MDIYSAAHKLQIHPSGIKFKKEFKAFTDVPRLFALTEAPPDFQEIRDKLALLCADNHEEFSHPKPLWKNPEFFVQLPFKLNEDVNPTKATHPGIDPVDRYKTAFCIPNAQYQWTVMPFGLKVVSSLFQKTMTKIFEPILDRAIITLMTSFCSLKIWTHTKGC